MREVRSTRSSLVFPLGLQCVPSIMRTRHTRNSGEIMKAGYVSRVPDKSCHPQLVLVPPGPLHEIRGGWQTRFLSVSPVCYMLLCSCLFGAAITKYTRWVIHKGEAFAFLQF